MGELRKAVVLTAYNRIPYLQEVLTSWKSVKSVEDWDFIASVEKSPVQEDVTYPIRNFLAEVPFNRSAIILRDTRLGVLEHPYTAMDELFTQHHYDFVFRVEDDLLVSNDVLDYASWASHTFESDKRVGAVCAYHDEVSSDTTGVFYTPEFNPLNWGTWRDRWIEYIGPTWDRDYSTFNGSPGNQSGWDWNINTRVFPRLGKTCVRPFVSRVQNIGREGTHAIPSEFPQSPSFSSDLSEVSFELRGR